MPMKRPRPLRDAAPPAPPPQLPQPPPDAQPPPEHEAMPPPLPLCDCAVFPGDEVGTVADFSGLVLGSGVFRDGDLLRACRVGVLRWTPSKRSSSSSSSASSSANHRGRDGRLWVEGEVRRYVPALGDHVIGIVDAKHVDDYRLNIGAASGATLPVLAFDGATKRNRPHLEVGALVYARVSLAHKDMEPECTCAAPAGIGAKDWVTRESVFGELHGGHVFTCPMPLCRRLMGLGSGGGGGEGEGGEGGGGHPADDEVPPVLEALGALAPFELAVGANGRVWLSSNVAALIVLAQASILKSQGVDDAQHEELVEEISRAFDLAPGPMHDAMAPPAARAS